MHNSYSEILHSNQVRSGQLWLGSLMKTGCESHAIDSDSLHNSMCYLLEQLFKGLQDEDGGIVGPGALSQVIWRHPQECSNSHEKKATLSTRLAAPWFIRLLSRLLSSATFDTLPLNQHLHCRVSKAKVAKENFMRLHALHCHLPTSYSCV